MTTTTARGLRVGELAKAAGIAPDTVRYYERAGLLRRRLAELDAEMARLAALRAQMQAMAAALPSANCPPPVPGTWCPPEEGR